MLRETFECFVYAVACAVVLWAARTFGDHGHVVLATAACVTLLYSLGRRHGTRAAQAGRQMNPQQGE